MRQLNLVFGKASEQIVVLVENMKIARISAIGWFNSPLRSLLYSPPVANKGFRGAVSPLFDPGFTGSFCHFSCKEVPDLQKINLFTRSQHFS